MTRPRLTADVAFALKFLQIGVLIVPLHRRSEKPDEVIVRAVDATLTLEKMRSSRRLMSIWAILVFVVCAVTARVVDAAVPTLVYIVLLSYPLLLVVIRVFEWAQQCKCEDLTKRLREERILEDK